MMKRIVISGLLGVLLAGAVVVRAQDAPAMPAPQKEHEWLQQFAGEWETEAEAFMEPGQPPMKSKGSESARTVGGFWIVAENEASIMDTAFKGIMTLGYDAEKKKYVGTWVDSMTSYLWKYEGTLDPTGKILTLEAEGPCPAIPGKMFRFRDVVEFKSRDHKRLTSSMQGEDGEWVTMVTVDARRKR